MIRTVLFDLDGTLLPIDTDRFIKAYLDLLSERFKSLVCREKFVNDLLKATGAMINNLDSVKINREVFFEDFVARVGFPQTDLELIFQEFYDHDFPRLESCLDSPPVLGEAVAEALRMGLEVVIATKPVFPKQAIIERLRWIGADKYNYKIITAYENMHFCKPHLEYFREILTLIDRKPADCVMIGNDVDEDLCAGKLGIPTILVKDYIVNRHGRDFKADFVISGSDLIGVIKNELPGL